MFRYRRARRALFKSAAAYDASGRPRAPKGTNLTLVSLAFAALGALGGIVASSIGVLNASNLPNINIALLCTVILFLLVAFWRIEAWMTSMAEERHEFEASPVTQEEFYERLVAGLLRARHTVDITHHEPRTPGESGPVTKLILFDILSRLAAADRFTLRWILAVDNQSKFDWLESILDKHRDHNNVNIRVSTFAVRGTVPTLSLQIVDRAEVLMIDIARGHHSSGEPDQDFYSTAPALLNQFQRYYDRYWDESTPIKEGSIVYTPALEALRRRVTDIPAGSSTVADVASPKMPVTSAATPGAASPDDPGASTSSTPSVTPASPEPASSPAGDDAP